MRDWVKEATVRDSASLVLAGLLLLALLQPGETVASSLQGSSLDDPAGIGEPVVNDEWEITVTSYEVRIQDDQQVFISMAVKNLGSTPRQVLGPLSFGLIGRDGVAIEFSQQCEGHDSSADDEFFADVFPNGVAEATLCWPIDSSDEFDPGLVTMYAVTGDSLFDDGTYSYFTLSDSTSVAPSPTPTATAEPTPSPVSTTYPPLMFSLVITVGDRYLQDSYPCETKGFYSGIKPSGEIVISNAGTNEILFATRLSRGANVPEGCSWTIVVLRLEGAERYEITVGEKHIEWFDYEDISDLDEIQILIGD